MFSFVLYAAVSALASVASAGDVFVHYMAQGLAEDHAAQDVQKALSLGVSAFALNVGTPDADWCKSAIKQLFDAAAGTDFKIFFSLDLYAKPDPYAFSELINQYSTHESYYVGGPNSAPFLSTFSDAGWSVDRWAKFLASLQTKPYFVPMFDQAPGYYVDPDGFWGAWDKTLDGSFSWEQAWPGNSEEHLNVTSQIDEKVMGVTHAHGKSYMMGLSSIQYKHFQGQHWFRSGDVVLPERMTQILSLRDKPEYVQIQTWNDAGESHYIGHLWKEGLTPEILAYANQEEHPHEGWQPLVASFIAAFKSGADASGMRPVNNQQVSGAMWHHEFLTSADCSSDELGKPTGHGAARDTVNWAVVIGEDLPDHYVQVWSGGKMIAKDPLSPGLNYKAVPNVNVGEQVIQVVDAAGVVFAEAGRSTKGISNNAPGLCNYNFQVSEVVRSGKTAKREEVMVREGEGDFAEELTTTVSAQVTATTTVTIGTDGAPVVEPTTTVKATSYSTYLVTVTPPVDGESEPTTTVKATSTSTTMVTVTPGVDGDSEPTTTVKATSTMTTTVTVDPSATDAAEPTTTVTEKVTATTTIVVPAGATQQIKDAGSKETPVPAPTGGRWGHGRPGRWRNRWRGRGRGRGRKQTE